MSPMTIDHSPVNGTTPSISNKACYLVELGNVVCEETAFPECGEDDVLVEVVCTGVCGSDLHLFCHGRAGPFKLEGPHVMGHESAGIVNRIGSRVKGLRVGDKVAIEPSVPCRKCRFCKTGSPNLCTSARACGLPPFKGSLCEWFSCPSDLAVKLPADFDWKAAGCIQPLAVAVHLIHRSGIRAGQTIAVYGSGPLGLLTMAVAKAYGCSKIIAFDIAQSRLEFAVKHYATHGFISSRRPETMEAMEFANAEAIRIVKDAEIEDGVDVAVDASGVESCMQAGCALVRPGGTFVEAGLGKPTSTFPMLTVVEKEINVLGSVRYSPGCFKEAIDLVAHGKIDLSAFVTATYPIERCQEAFDAVKAGKDIKVVIFSKDV